MMERIRKCANWEFPGGLVVRILTFTARGAGWILGWGTKSLQARPMAKNGKKEKKEKGGTYIQWNITLS